MTTLFTGKSTSTVGNAVYFDVAVSTCIDITRFDCNFNTTTGTSTPGLAVYLTAGTNGTSVGNELNSQMWALAGVDDGKTKGSVGGTPTVMNLAAPIQLNAGNYGMALVSTGAVGHIFSSNFTSKYSDPELRITTGSASSRAFATTFYASSTWNGSICYFPCPAECWLVLGDGSTNVQVGSDPQDRLFVSGIGALWPVLQATVPTIPIPNEPKLIGLETYWQVALYNPTFFPSDPVMMSNGFKVPVGGVPTPYGTGSGLTLIVPTMKIGQGFRPAFIFQ